MLSGALLVITLAAGGQVTPEAAREAAQLARSSELEYDLGHADIALRDLERAYRLDPRPGLLFNLGQCHRMLKNWEQAETAYRSYLRRRPEAANRAEVLQLIVEMRREQGSPAVPAPQPVREESSPANSPPSYPASSPASAEEAAPPPPVRPPRPRELPAPASPPLVSPAPQVPYDATTQSSTASAQSSAWPWVFGVSAIVSAGVSTWGWVQVAGFESLRGSSSFANPTPATQAQSSQSSAVVGEAVGIIGLVAVLGLTTGLVLTW